MVHGREGGRGGAKHKSVKRKMVKPPAGPRVLLVRIGASGTVAVQILQRKRITQCPQDCRIEQAGQAMSSFSPEAQKSCSVYNNAPAENDAKHGNQRVVRNDIVEVRIRGRA